MLMRKVLDYRHLETQSPSCTVVLDLPDNGRAV